mmetsp:Transcript_21865/g.33237  ORF Transcript_21865/g.33237 Transcript_21865/m.33237 type:complete len:364 (+) Transcript_21865:104-1195(+)
MVRVIMIVCAAVIGMQWCMISFLLARLHRESMLSQITQYPENFNSKVIEQSKETSQGKLLSPSPVPQDMRGNHALHHTDNRIKQYEGVAVTLMLNSPKWFQRRYTTMIQNILNNTPETWAVQIFYVPSGQSQLGLDLNPGISRMDKRIIMTEIPSNIAQKYGMKRKKGYWTNKWMWETMVANKVLVFSGNGAICSNSKLSLLDGTAMKIFSQFDYIGPPWRNLGGEGGDGAISYRNRTAMLDAINYEESNGQDSEDYYFIKTLKDMNKKHGKTYRIASKEQTYLVGIEKNNFDETQGPPMIISGTLSSINHDTRNTILELCPELKVIFPSLHNPSCFGAHPDAKGCADSICALKDQFAHPHGC